MNRTSLLAGFSISLTARAVPIRACPIRETSAAQACGLDRNPTQHALVGRQGQTDFR